jgi:dynein heavy chain
MFERHRSFFAFLLAVRLQTTEGALPPELWKLFVFSSGAAARTLEAHSSRPAWLDEERWVGMITLEATRCTQWANVTAHLVEEDSEWQAWASSAAPHLAPLPPKYRGDALSRFDVLLLVRLLCPDRLVIAVHWFVAQILPGLSKLAAAGSEADELLRALRTAPPLTPIICILSAGTDPLNSILQLHQQHAGGAPLHLVSLGQGQGAIAERCMDEAQVEGGWVILQNCHVAPSWLALVDAKLSSWEANRGPEDAVDSSQAHMRLWLTTNASEVFPVGLLHIGIKVACDAPVGLRASLMRSYTELPTRAADGPTRRGAGTLWSQLVFLVSFFHAIVSERRRFGTIAWSVPYDWTPHDLQVSLKTCRAFAELHGLEEGRFLDSLHFVIGELHYGGRVSDPMDRRLLGVLLAKILRPAAFDAKHQLVEGSVDFHTLPEPASWPEYKQMIDALPSSDGPAVFGLNDNAQFALLVDQGRSLLQWASMTRPPDRVSAVLDNIDLAQPILETCSAIAAQLPEALSSASAAPSVFRSIGLKPNPMGSFVSVEMAKCNRLLGRLKLDVQDMLDAMHGRIAVSSSLDDVAAALVANSVPPSWAQVPVPCLNPGRKLATALVANTVPPSRRALG